MSETTTLTPPAPVKALEPDKALHMVPLKDEAIEALDAKIADFISTIITTEVQSEPFKQAVANAHQMGNKEIRAAAQVSNRMLERPAKVVDNQILGKGTTVGDALVDLRLKVEELDPSRQGNLFDPIKILGLFPFGNKLKRYFAKYQSSQTQLNEIMEALYRGQDELQRDNAAIEEEKGRLWGLMESLRKYVYIGKKLDEELSGKVAEVEAQSPAKARVLKEELLFYLRQKVQDLLTQEAVSVQGYLALDMIRKNNLELIKGVDRATTTTISALRTAVMVASALKTQKLVLDQIRALNKTTEEVIVGTSEMLKTQSADIQRDAASSTLELDKLKAAFGNIYAAMDSMSEFKLKALDNMQQTVTSLETELEKANDYLKRSQGQPVEGSVVAEVEVKEEEPNLLEI